MVSAAVAVNITLYSVLNQPSFIC